MTTAGNSYMFRAILLFIMVFFVGFQVQAQNGGETYVRGELAEDTTWAGTVVLEETVTVPAGIILNIERGTIVSMMDSVSLIVYGQLIADGNEAEPIRFTRHADNITWKQIIFIEAEDSRFTHCIFEYADCEGSHQDYYEPGPRDYHEAIVALATHLDFEGCTFRNLPDGGSGAEGDAMAIISDDPNYPGESSANIRNCRFLSIGQSVHTRFSYVLIEDCFFTGKRGDNDDVDLWGESTPPPLIQNNLFLNPEHDDMINPTRCSAVIIGNVIIGSDDHGIVLRDRGFPVVMNNLIVDCGSAGMAIENSCDALLVNNTIVDCGRGLRLFDLGRWGPPYRLNPGGGTATVVNCIIWDCPQPVTLADSSSTEIEDTGSHITISYSVIPGGQDGVIISGTNSTVTWGEGNIDIDPQFTDPANGDYHLKSQAGRFNPNTQSWVIDDITSPCIDAGDPNTPVGDELFPNGGIINMGAYGGTAEASKSKDDTTSLSVAYIYYDDLTAAQSFQSLLESYGCPTIVIKTDDEVESFWDSFDLVIVANDTHYLYNLERPNILNSLKWLEKPIIGLGEGGYDFFGKLNLSIGSPNGARSSFNAITVIDPNCTLFSKPYPIDIPQDGILQLYTETDDIAIYLWPDIPETVFTIATESNNLGYYPLIMEDNQYFLWGFTESPEKMTDIGKKLFVNTVIWTAYMYNSRQVNIDDDDNGSQVAIEQRQTLVVTLESNTPTGYHWEVVEDPNSILEQVGGARFLPSDPFDYSPGGGTGGWEVFRFRAVSPGRETLELVYRRSWETDVEPAKIFSIDVIVN